MSDSTIFIYPGGPCTCKPGRYVRFAIPRGVKGCEAVVACRELGAAQEHKAEHPLPANAEVLIRVPTLGTR